jgi:hypothetical protein
MILTILGGTQSQVRIAFHFGRCFTLAPHLSPDLSGNAMAPSTNESFPASQWQFIEVAANNVVFVTTNGNGQWDNNGGRNYVACTSGIPWLIPAHSPMHEY